jgi:drug/metabolite transporter (DMT)-like permease
MRQSMIPGILAGAFAAASWSLGFIAPFVIGSYSMFDFALTEFAFSGVLSAALLWRRADRVRLLRPSDWLAACFLGVIGYFGYFLAVMGAAVYAGPVIAPAFLGLVPVVLAVVGNLRQRTVSWKSLALPLVLATAGLLLVNGGVFARSGSLELRSLVLGIPLAILAIVLWTVFGLMNQAALARRPRMDDGVWSALIMVGAAAAMLAFLPIGLLLGLFEFSRIGLHWPQAAPLLMWAAILALFSNVGGAMAWTFASRSLPVALSAQLITVEPASATVLGLLIHRRWPSIAEGAGMVVLLIGVIIAIGIFSRPAASAATDPAPAA